MLDAHQRSQWAQTSEVLAMIANTVRDPKKRRRPFSGRDFSPFVTRKKHRTSIKNVVGMYGLKTRGSAEKKAR